MLCLCTFVHMQADRSAVAHTDTHTHKNTPDIRGPIWFRLWVYVLPPEGASYNSTEIMA